MRIAIGCDHKGLELKQLIMQIITDAGYNTEDFGCYTADSVDYPDIVTAGGTTVAVRIPAHPVPIALVEGLGMPVLGTSANQSGKPSALTADEVYSQLGDKIDLVIDGGRCPGGRESTIVDVTGETPVILREGAIPVAELERASGIKFKKLGRDRK